MLDFFHRWQMGRLCTILIAAILVGTAAMIAICALPSGRMLHQAQKSASIYEVEGINYAWAPGRESSAIDNWTNSLIVRQAIFPGSGNPVRDAMLNPSMRMLRIPGGNETSDLLHQLHGDEGMEACNYPRYWHGYLVVLKPLLCLANPSYLRLLNLLIQMILTSYLLLLLDRKLGLRVAAAYFVTYLLLNPVSLAMSFQYTPIYYITLGLSIFLLRRPQWEGGSRMLQLFLLSGILAAYFDLLTYPFVTLGIPLTVLLLLRAQSGTLSPREGWQSVAAAFLAWGSGYGFMQIGKWVMGWLLTGVNIPLDAIQEGLYRMSSHTGGAEGVQTFHSWTVIMKNLRVPLHEPIGTLLVLCLLVLLWQIWRKRHIIDWVGHRALLIALGGTALLPFVWYFALTNHSYVHAWMAYRELAITVFALGSLAGRLLPASSEGGTRDA